MAGWVVLHLGHEVRVDGRAIYSGKGFGLVDDKGRVAIPNVMRHALAKNSPRDDGKDGGTVIIGPHPKYRCLIAYDPGYLPMLAAEVEQLEAAHFARTGEIDYNIRDRANGGEPLPFDGSGRFIMPTYERHYARIRGAAVFWGRQHWISIWAPDVLHGTDGIDEYMKEFVEFACAEKGIAL